MKFKIKDKDINIEPATLRQIAELEKAIGSLSSLGDSAAIDSILKIIEVAMKHTPQEEGVTIDWLLDNCGMGDISSLNEVVSHFLGVSALSKPENS